MLVRILMLHFSGMALVNAKTQFIVNVLNACKLDVNSLLKE